MSRALAVSQRIARDAYYTPAPLAAACVEALQLTPGTWALEPHAGGGAFVRALSAAGAVVLARDVNPDAPGLACADSASVGPFLEVTATDASVVVGNPPYRDAERHIRHALSLAPRVAFLLRMGILGSRGRAPLWRDWPPARVWVVQGRPSFTGGGTDSVEYAWIEWDEQHRGAPELGWLAWSGDSVAVREREALERHGQLSLLGAM